MITREQIGRHLRGGLYAWWAVLALGWLAVSLLSGRWLGYSFAVLLCMPSVFASAILSAFAARDAFFPSPERTIATLRAFVRPAERAGRVGALLGTVVGATLACVSFLVAIGTIFAALTSNSTVMGPGTWVLELVLGAVIYVPAFIVTALGGLLYSACRPKLARHLERTRETIDAATSEDKTDVSASGRTPLPRPTRMALAMLFGSWTLIAIVLSVGWLSRWSGGFDPLVFLVMPPMLASATLCAFAASRSVSRR